MRLLLSCALLLGSASTLAAERVVTLAPHLAELVCAVQRCDRLVGVSAYTDMPAAAAALPQAGDAYSVNLEAVLALQPDLVLVWDGGTAPATLQRLRGLGLRVEAVKVGGLDEIAAALLRVGKLVDAAAAAQAAAEDYRDALAGLRRTYAGRPRLRVFYQTETAPAFSVSRRSPIHEALDLCGGANVFADLPGLAAAVSLEAVVAARPEVVVHTRQEDEDALARYWARLPALPPADPRRRIAVDGNALTRQSPRVLDGIAELCAGLDRVRALSSGAR